MIGLSKSSSETMIASAISSVVSVIYLVLMVSFISLVDSPVNIVMNPLEGMKLAVLCVFFQCALRAIVLSSLFPRSFSLFHEKLLRDKIVEVFNSLALLGFTAVAFHAIAVCYGAPVFSKTSETFHLGCLLAAVVVLPCFIVIGPNVDRLTRVFFDNKPDLGLETVVTFTSAAAIFGAWLGAIVIPLDWDRPWQEWPVPCAVGALGGYTAGHAGAALYLPASGWWGRGKHKAT